MTLTEYIEAGRITQSQLAAAVGVSPSMVWQWRTGHRPIAAERVLAIEAATGISRHDLRPDIYPRESAA